MAKLKKGQTVEVETTRGWVDGVFDGYTAGFDGEKFCRMNVRAGKRYYQQCHPDSVRVKEDTRTTDEKAGVKAILFLQSLAGEKEPEGKALFGWREMTYYEQQQTIIAYETLSRSN